MKPLKSLSLLLVFAFLVVSVGAPSRNVAAQTYCDWAQYVADVTVPDGTNFEAGTSFTKTWRLKNIGSCTWTTGYSLVFSSGEKMGGPDSVPLPSNVAPGQTVEISVNLTAPSAAGAYRGFWMLKNASGAVFGIGTTASKSFWVDIKVPKPYVTAYDFTKDFCSATWHYNGGPIPCPAVKDRDKVYGYVEKYDNPTLEDGTAAGKPGLLYIMEDGYSKYIQGVYPAMDLFPGDHFQATIGCEGGAASCYVNYRLEFMNPTTMALTTIWSSYEKYDGRYVNIDIDLTKFAWKKGQLVLSVYSYGPGKGDRFLWVAPRIARQVDTIPITPTPGPSPTPVVVKTPSNTCTDRVKFVADVTVPDWTTFAPNAPFTKTWRLMNVGTCTWTTAYTLVFFSGNRMGAAEINSLPSSVAPGGLIDLSLNLIAPATPNSYLSSWIFKNEKKVNFGVGANYDKAIFAAIKVAGTPLPTVTLAPLLIAPPVTSTPVPSNVYVNSKYGFSFTKPADSSLTAYSDNRARLTLPFAAGTTLLEKYLDVVVTEGLTPCKAAGFTNPASGSSNVTINGTNFLVENGTDSALGNVYEWKSYSTVRNNACVSMNFILHFANNGAPVFDRTAEAGVFDTVMTTFK
jgi:hypothetical protein